MKLYFLLCFYLSKEFFLFDFHLNKIEVTKISKKNIVTAKQMYCSIAEIFFQYQSFRQNLSLINFLPQILDNLIFVNLFRQFGLHCLVYFTNSINNLLSTLSSTCCFTVSTTTHLVDKLQQLNEALIGFFLLCLPFSVLQTFTVRNSFGHFLIEARRFLEHLQYHTEVGFDFLLQVSSIHFGVFLHLANRLLPL